MPKLGVDHTPAVVRLLATRNPNGLCWRDVAGCVVHKFANLKYSVQWNIMVYRKQKSNTYCELRTSDCDCNRVSSQASTNTNPLMLLSQKSSHTVDICRYENQQCRGYTSAVIYSIHQEQNLRIWKLNLMKTKYLINNPRMSWQIHDEHHDETKHPIKNFISQI